MIRFDFAKFVFFSALVSMFMPILVASQAYATPDENAGKQKASVCMACHGPEGVSANDLWPNLAGQKEEYLFKQLKAFHDGQRYDPLMTPMAKMLSEKEMRDLARYYAKLP